MNEDELKEENAELYADYEALADEHTKLRDQNARLKAEVERLTQNTDKLCKHGDLEIARLKAEVERLRKAGDAICATYELGDDFLPPIQAWNAAKEGKQP